MRGELAQKLLRKTQQLQQSPNLKKRCFIGFDGVTDEIISAVATRHQNTVHPFKQIADFGNRIVDAAGKSCNIELLVRLTKIGGNAPILADALLKGFHHIVFSGTIGEKNHIEPLFSELAAACEEVFPLGPSAHSDAIEFDDGKVIFGKLANFKNIDYAHLIKAIGKERLKEILDHSNLFISANWTMLFKMNELWENILKEIMPLSQKQRFHFVDLADPAKRTDEDLKEALKLLKEFNQSYQVILGLNEAEALRIAHVFSLPKLGDSKENLLKTAQAIQEKSGLYKIVIHATHFACASSLEIVDGPYTSEPYMTTGAGDNFNAGFCNGLLYDFTTEESLLLGVATSGYYVRTGKSPSMEELGHFLEKWK